MNDFKIPSTIANAWVQMRRLIPDDFELLYQAASDPLIWEQHPNPDRYKKEVFSKYFEGAINSGGAFLVTDARNGEVIGCTRFYDFDPVANSICIGYTFVVRRCWGLPYNRSMKSLMLDYAFQFTDSVLFHIGESNLRSQKAIGKIGAVKTGEQEMSYYGETPHLNYVYTLIRGDWQHQ